MFKKIIDFVTIDIWRMRLESLPHKHKFFIKHLRVILVAIKGFDEDKCQLRASALTYYSLLSVVPVVAMAFGIAKGFGFAARLENLIIEKMAGQSEAAGMIIEFSQTLLENTKGGVIAGIGIAILFWAVIKVLGSIEMSFNDIWGIKENRSMARKFSDYLSIMLIAPILVMASSSMTVFISSQIASITEQVALLGAISPLINGLLRLLPFCILWILFTFIYIFMPNTKVQFSSALIAGIFAGTIYQVVQWSYITFQIGVSKFNAIYGSFAALPLLLVWLQLSWLIVLLGAEISFAYQNVDTYEFEPDCLKVSYSFKTLITLTIMHLLVKNFSQGSKHPTATDISHVLDIPIRLVREILYELVESGLVSEVETKKYRQFAYQPARDVDTLTVKSVIDLLEQKGVDSIPVAQSGPLKEIANTLNKFSNMIKSAPENKLLKNI